MLFRNLLTALACCGLIAGVPSHGAAAEDWRADSPYYEEDAWYDVTEWFDGNDYHTTEAAESDNDYDYNYDGSTSDQYVSGYGYAAENNDSHTYGYDDRYKPDNWFYDYWDDGFAYFHDSDNDGVYNSYYSYNDFDGDGLYDAYYSYVDRDDDGVYDDVNHYFFNDQSTSASDSSNSSKQKEMAKRGQQESKSSKREMVQGEVVKTKKTTVRDTKHLIVQLKKSNGKKCLVDLGPANKLQQMDLQQGDQISVRGPITKVGDRRVLIGQELKAPGQSQGFKQIQRNGQQFRGKVADTRTSKVHGMKHSFAILASANNDKKKLVDLGATNQLGVDLEQGDQITVTATPVKVNDRVVLMAQEVRCNGKKCEIDRSAAGNSQKSRKQQKSKSRDSQQARNSQHIEGQRDWHSPEDAGDHQASSQRPARSVAGKVQSTHEVTVRGNDRKLATIKTRNGDRLLVDLGPADEFDEHLRNGDTITVRGPMVKTSKNMPVVLARSLERDGEKIHLGRRGTMHSDTTQKTLRGEIESTRKVTVNGKQRQLAKIETDQGKSVVVDLGAPTVLDMDLAEGDQLVASGAIVKGDNQLVLIAYEVEDQNGNMIAIDRRNSKSRGGQQSSSNK